MKKTIIITIVAIVFVALAVTVAFYSVPATAIKYEEKISECESNIQVEEQARAELLPLLADAVKSYDKHEYQTFMDTVKARTEEDGTISDQTVNEINQIIKVIVEKYPDLKSNENYKKFMNESAITENKITETRKAYNSAITRYNNYTRHPLKKFFLNLSGYEICEFERLTYDVSKDAYTDLFNLN